MGIEFERFKFCRKIHLEGESAKFPRSMPWMAYENEMKTIYPSVHAAN